VGFRIRVNEPHEPQALGTRTFLRVPVGEERLHDKEREKLSRTRPLPSFATIRPAPTSVAEAAPRGSLGDSHLAEVALRDLVATPRGALSHPLDDSDTCFVVDREASLAPPHPRSKKVFRERAYVVVPATL